MKYINSIILSITVALVGVFIYLEYTKPKFNVKPAVESGNPQIEPEVVDLRSKLEEIKNHNKKVKRDDPAEERKRELPVNDFITSIYESGSILDSIDSIYERMKAEIDPNALHELSMIFFDVLYKSDPTEEEYNNIIEKTMDLIDDPKTRPYAIRHISQVLDDAQMEAVFNYYSPIMTEEEKGVLANQYVNFRTINGKEPFNNKSITDIYKKKAKNR
uniref:Uncharacterized protein n=1 Tax=Candidatus Kentrum sp. LPFa TaxID=2126335 RepID=A0A450WLL8_9GAMM|nr:MAG: hypothetical protein BECKLPF1236B_GA0070989_11294 [Candidatus Kentron sp. LPFa]